MDRSFLSQPDVITASRRFVCIRLTTYEDEAENRFLKSLMVGRSGDVENTTFAILAPDGKTRLSRVSRGTRGLFTDSEDLARTLEGIAARYPDVGKTPGTPALPVTLDARLGLNVAASDGLPLIAILAADERTRSALETRVATLAWSPEFLGRFTYAAAATRKEFPGVQGVPTQDAVLLIEPDPFGQEGKVLQHLSGEFTEEQLAQAMRRILTAHPRTAKNVGAHRAQATQKGAFWDTKLPVTDPQEAAARERTRRAMPRQEEKKER